MEQWLDLSFCLKQQQLKNTHRDITTWMHKTVVFKTWTLDEEAVSPKRWETDKLSPTIAPAFVLGQIRAECAKPSELRKQRGMSAETKQLEFAGQRAWEGTAVQRTSGDVQRVLVKNSGEYWTAQVWGPYLRELEVTTRQGTVPIHGALGHEHRQAWLQ